MNYPTSIQLVLYQTYAGNEGSNTSGTPLPPPESSMEYFDPVWLTIYLILLIVFLFSIYQSFNDEYTIKLDESHLKEQLESQNFQDWIEISFNFEKRYEMDKEEKKNDKKKDDAKKDDKKDNRIKQFGLNIKNKSKTHSIYIDWDCCALTDLMGRSRRVTRLIPGSTLDLFQVQAFSSVGPNSTLKEAITAEDVLKRNESKDSPVALKIEVDKPLLNFVALSKGKDPEKKRYKRFFNRLDPLEIYLDLVFRFIGSGSTRESDPRQLRCRLVLNKLPWKAGLPWNPR